MEQYQDVLYHISRDRILSRLDPDFRDLNVFCFDTIDSTNDEAKRRFRAGLRSPSIFVSDQQTSGRGRRGRTFYSPSRTGIYLSLLLPLSIDRSDFLSFTSRAAVGVCRALNRVYQVPVKIKWVNDILLCGKKICGILSEFVTDPHTSENAVVIGIGINLFTEDFPDTISDIAGSVGSSSIPREACAAAVAQDVVSLIRDPDPSYLDEYRSLCTILGSPVSYERNCRIFQGTAIDIDDSAALIVLRNDGTTDVLNTGEITVRPLPSQ